MKINRNMLNMLRAKKIVEETIKKMEECIEKAKAAEVNVYAKDEFDRALAKFEEAKELFASNECEYHQVKEMVEEANRILNESFEISSAAIAAEKKSSERAVRAALKELKEEGIAFNDAITLLKEGAETKFEKDAVAAIAAQWNRLGQIQSYIEERFGWTNDATVTKALARNSVYNAIKANLDSMRVKFGKAIEALWNAEHKKAKEILDSVKASLDATKKADYALKKAHEAFKLFDAANIKFADSINVEKLTRSKAAMSVLKSLISINYGRDAWAVVEKTLPKLRAEKKNKGIEALMKKFNGAK